LNPVTVSTKKRPRLARPLSTTKTPKKTILSGMVKAIIGPKKEYFSHYFSPFMKILQKGFQIELLI
jgi:hypothetical protein